MKQFKSFFSPLSLGEGSGVRPLSLFLFASLFLASCGEQTELEQPGATNGETVAVTKELRINVVPMQTVGSPATRSGSSKPEQGESIDITYGEDVATRGTSELTAKESEINNAYILQFDGTAPASKLITKKVLTPEELNGTAPITCNFTMTENVKNRVYVVANLTAEQIAAIDNNETEAVTLVTFEEPVDFDPSASLAETTGLPMSAMQDIGVGDVFDVFQLKSVLAKLTFTCKTEGATLLLKGVPNGYSFAKVQPGDKAVRPDSVTYDKEGVALTSGTAYYVPENLSGRVQLSSPLVRCSLFAPTSSLFVEISANDTTYNIYLGDSSASDFNFVGSYAYNVNATIYGTSDMDFRVGTPTIAALDGGGTANCYLPTEADTWYSFNATVMGNGATTLAHTVTAVPGDANFGAIIPSTLNSVSAEVLWESDNTATAPAKGTIVNNTVYRANGRVLFKSGSAMGNAVIAAKDATGTIVWSWHIWRTEVAPAGVALKTITDGNGFTVSTLNLMDRNLGALRATPATEANQVQDYGLYYQWGRKDPFQTQGGVSTVYGGSPAEAVKNPTTFYTSSSDWTLRNDNLWGCPLTELVTINSKSYNKNAGSKSIYDPCPAGWRVAPAYTFANAAKPTSWSSGYDFDGSLTAEGTSLFFPAMGRRDVKTGNLSNVTVYGNCWTSSPHTESYYASGFYLKNGDVKQTYDNHRATGVFVRCVR